jgi:phosphonate metabolism protein PhnN/1,5-bisphosphokinase (PRPP-forming)
MKSKIVLIVGPSGVGKDSLLSYAKDELKDRINFVKRYITREADENEDNYHLDDYAFEILKHNSFFISTWNVHNNIYGISKNSIINGLNIISISRSRVKDFENIYEKVYTMNITVSSDELRKRLNKRGRESKEEIEKRLLRSDLKIDAKNLIKFDNSACFEESKENFIELLKKIENE